jgi:tetratricopeptide (TPR) repeat protein
MLRSTLEDDDPRPGKPYGGNRYELWELAVVMARGSRYEEAEKMINWAFTLPAQQSATVGEQCPAHSLAVMSEARGQFADAAGLYATALEFSIATQGAASRVVAGDTVHLANALRELGESDDAERVVKQAIEICNRLGQLKGVRYCAAAYLDALETLAAILTEREQHQQAADLLRESLRLHEKWSSPSDWTIARTRILLGECLARAGCCEEAQALVVEGFNQLSAQLAPEHEEYRRARVRLEAVRAACSASDSVHRRR